ncbi:aspartate-semialdehyde dehydrogenase [Starmerella bacillaris]|uniref:Aspartate-semialdehyde dehydrogenase n=1 Tax=Starmerella bacillaris TaxID=1247836 RepID=A0AAV5RLQ6_STABA|nr:aspartate-semialdehyde dehydrogenase [Starmerella bacillaris]
MAGKLKAGVLGATGSVGQRFILLLQGNPLFDLVALGASSRSAGKAYAKVTSWKQGSHIPTSVADIVVTECVPEAFKGCDVVFSGLDASVAGEIEEQFVNAGLNIISNAKNFRQHSHVPLCVPTANPEHLDALEFRDKSRGIHVCISNCSTAGLVVALKALTEKFGPISHVVLTTLQAISGAGFSPGVGGMDILDNIVPYIGGEEDKLEIEPRKILGSFSTSSKEFQLIPEQDMKISATTTRVPVIDGHTASVSIKFANTKPSLAEVQQCLTDYSSQCETLHCPSAPEKPLVYLEQPDRPQPRLDRDIGNGFTVSVGRLREDSVLDYKFVCLSHNTVLGAAGSGILIAELLHAKKLI